jgi:hypothetical protein
MREIRHFQMDTRISTGYRWSLVHYFLTLQTPCTIM